MIDVLEPEEEFHVVRFQQMAKEAHGWDLSERTHSLLSWAAPGFYIQALLYDISTLTENEGDHRLPGAAGSSWHREEGSCIAARRCLREVDDPQRAALEDIHANNVKRVIRALEFYQQTGDSYLGSQCQKNGKKNLPIQLLPILCLHDDRVTPV